MPNQVDALDVRPARGKTHLVEGELTFGVSFLLRGQIPACLVIVNLISPVLTARQPVNVTLEPVVSTRVEREDHVRFGSQRLTLVERDIAHVIVANALLPVLEVVSGRQVVAHDFYGGFIGAFPEE